MILNRIGISPKPHQQILHVLNQLAGLSFIASAKHAGQKETYFSQGFVCSPCCKRIVYCSCPHLKPRFFPFSSLMHFYIHLCFIRAQKNLRPNRKKQTCTHFSLARMQYLVKLDVPSWMYVHLYDDPIVIIKGGMQLNYYWQPLRERRSGVNVRNWKWKKTLRSEQAMGYFFCSWHKLHHTHTAIFPSRTIPLIFGHRLFHLLYKFIRLHICWGKQHGL